MIPEQTNRDSHVDGLRRLYLAATVNTNHHGMELEGDYPQSWEEFSGQPLAVQTLRMFATAARKRGKPMGHVLLANATPGIGKTALALLVAKELGGSLKIISGKVTAQDAAGVLMRMTDGDVLFIDEIHQLAAGNRRNAEWLLHYMQSGTLVGVSGMINVPRVTIIGATTDASVLPPALLSRFAIRPILEPYTDDQAADMAIALSRKVLVPEGFRELDYDEARLIASAGNRNPRMMRRLLTTLLDVVTADGLAPQQPYPIDVALFVTGIDADGMSVHAWQYLEILDRDFNGVGGIDAMTERLASAGGNVPEIESVLLDKGYITRRTNGRTLTAAGLRALTAHQRA